MGLSFSGPESTPRCLWLFKTSRKRRTHARRDPYQHRADDAVLVLIGCWSWWGAGTDGVLVWQGAGTYRALELTVLDLYRQVVDRIIYCICLTPKLSILHPALLLLFLHPLSILLPLTYSQDFAEYLEIHTKWIKCGPRLLKALNLAGTQKSRVVIKL